MVALNSMPTGQTAHMPTGLDDGRAPPYASDHREPSGLAGRPALLNCPFSSTVLWPNVIYYRGEDETVDRHCSPR